MFDLQWVKNIVKKEDERAKSKNIVKREDERANLTFLLTNGYV